MSNAEASHFVISLKNTASVRVSLDEDDELFKLQSRSQAASHESKNDPIPIIDRLYTSQLDFVGCGYEFGLLDLNIDYNSLLGSGTFPVYRASLISTSQQLAVKTIFCFDSDRLNYCINEAKVSFHITKQHHDDPKYPAPLVNYLGFLYDDLKQDFHLVFQPIDGVILCEAIISTSTVELKLKWINQLASAIYRLHSEHVFHNDIIDGTKFGNVNILVNNDSLCLIDLGDAIVPHTLKETNLALSDDLTGFNRVIKKIFPALDHPSILNCFNRCKETVESIERQEYMAFNKACYYFSLIVFLSDPDRKPQTLDSPLSRDIKEVCDFLLGASQQSFPTLVTSCTFTVNSCTFSDSLTNADRRMVHSLAEYYGEGLIQSKSRNMSDSKRQISLIIDESTKQKLIQQLSNNPALPNQNQ